ncbi:MAG: hypothetical protein KDA88_09585 [Planctomycetaceae bacterium]|nr:hypothetical protein [Planctomycetaceae bacterium]
MASRKNKKQSGLPKGIDAAQVRELVGYLNFSSGNSDPLLLKGINNLWDPLDAARKSDNLRETLLASCQQLHADDAAFSDVSQAEAVIELALNQVLPAYREYHRDLLFHLQAEDFEQPFFLARIIEATLQQGGDWTEAERIISESLKSLNDFVGYRPVAVLENGRKMEIYSHERFHPLPLYTREAGVAKGPYSELISRVMEFLTEAPQDILHDSYLDLDRLDELCCDQRAHDHMHPVNKRTNYLFGEWDPHQINTKGYYHRFVVRKLIMDALVDWVDHPKSRANREERLFDAAAALCGTMLMASSISGAGPDTHNSTISLTNLLPLVARRRDIFYARLMDSVDGPRKARLMREQRKTQQPFGHIRQHLNMQLAGYGAQQVQHRELSHMYAIMGYAEASREHAIAIPAASTRIESEIECTINSAHRAIDHGSIQQACEYMAQLPDLLKRGVECGALVDPWNILGFHGQFPLFAAREDSIPDNRVETLLDLMEGVFGIYSRCLGEAAAQGHLELAVKVSNVFQSQAEWWDRFGSSVIEDLPKVLGTESWESATNVSDALGKWREAGEAAGDISFWRQHVERFQSAQAYALVVSTLLDKQDFVASMGLMMQWMSQLSDVGFESPHHSIFELLIRWMRDATRRDPEPLTAAERPVMIRRLLDFLEANAEDWWGVPSMFGEEKDMAPESFDMGQYEDLEGLEDESDDDEDNLFSAAYDDMVFRDTADDGNWGNTVDDQGPGVRTTMFEQINRDMEPRLKFLLAVGHLYQLAASSLAADLHEGATLATETTDALVRWHRQSQRWQIDLAELMETIADFDIMESSGDHDANIEYDIQLQVKYYLLHQIINTLICHRNAERLLNGVIPEDVVVARGNEQDRRLTVVYRAIVQRDIEAVRNLLPDLLARLGRNPLLYVPLDHGGEAGQVLRIQSLQSVIRFLLRELPRMGLLRETWHLLATAFRMERKWRPQGQAITEFDRLFEIALTSTLDSLVGSAGAWHGPDVFTEELIEAIGKVLDPYQWLWSEHSRTMRISAVDGLRSDDEWQDMADFIRSYGADLFHASQLTLGNVRAILHNGVDWYLEYLEEEQDPLRPIKLLEDLDRGLYDRERAVWCLEQTYSIIVDRFDRFLEYNTTTTQSDYGEMLFCLLDFLRLEVRYDRDAWNLTPLTLVHNSLARNQLTEASEIWEATFEMQTADIAEQHLEDLERLQKQYGMRMPTITDHLNERFVKPLDVNRILALVKQSVEDARQGVKDSEAFIKLRAEVNDYLKDSWGSGVDVPNWLRQMDREISEASRTNYVGRPTAEAELELPPVPISLADFQSQTKTWKTSLIDPYRRRGRKKSRGNSTEPDTSESTDEPDSGDAD